MALKPEHKEAIKAFTASHNGKPLDQKQLMKANPLIQKVLAARFASMTDEQQNALKKILTPETYPSLKILLPEVSELLDRGLRFVKRGMRNG